MLVRIEVHVDTLCPWCYIQKKSLDAAVERYQAKYPAMEFELLYRPFYLYPFLHTSMSSPLVFHVPIFTQHTTYQPKTKKKEEEPAAEATIANTS